MAKKKQVNIQQSFFEDEHALGVQRSPYTAKESEASNTPMDITGLGLDEDMKSWDVYLSGGGNPRIPIKKLDMEDKKLIELIYKHYQHVFDHVNKSGMSNDITRLLSYLKSSNCLDGVCHYSRYALGYAITKKQWIHDYCFTAKLYWAPPPRLCQKTHEIISSLSARVEILKKILDEYDTRYSEREVL